MEERRLAGARMLREGRRQSEIARELGVSEAAVSQWKRELEENGTGALRANPATGRPSKLDPMQRAQLRRYLQQGARSAGYASDQWTQSRVQQLIQRQFGVWYHPNYVGRLMAQLGMSSGESLEPTSEEPCEVTVFAIE